MNDPVYTYYYSIQLQTALKTPVNNYFPHGLNSDENFLNQHNLSAFSGQPHPNPHLHRLKLQMQVRVELSYGYFTGAHNRDHRRGYIATENPL